MAMRLHAFLLSAVLCAPAAAQPGLTIYNGGFAVVRDAVQLDLKAGENSVRYSGATSSLNPSTVILRDPAGKVALSILEQNYQNDPVNQMTLLDRFEGQTLGFLVREPQKGDRTVEGKVIRSGYTPGGEPVEPMIEVDGKIVFELPGRPLFPALKDDGILLKPLLSWKIQSPAAANLSAELAYLTQGLEWSASYNLVLPEEADTADLNGWVTIRNTSGKVFEGARIKLMAGDVHRAEPAPVQQRQLMKAALAADALGEPAGVSEKAFADFHLYTLPRPTNLRDQETKQLEFIRGAGIPCQRRYTYDPARGAQYFGRPVLESEFGAVFNGKKIESSLEFTNTETSSLGKPLPAGTLRVYRKDGEQLEFVGEDRLDHTPAQEKVRLKLGNAFDLVGERKRTDFQVDQARRTMDESFEIKLRNQGKKPVEIQAVEHLVRTTRWNLTAKTLEPRQIDSHTLEFTVPVAPRSEAVVKYTVHYSW
jgi:hypothetical protein